MRLFEMISLIAFVFLFIIVGCIKKPSGPEEGVSFLLSFKFVDQPQESLLSLASDSDLDKYPVLTKPNRLVIEDVLIFHFDENSDTVAHDATPYRHEGAIVGAEWIESPSGSALNFNGESQYVMVENESALNPTHSLELAAKFNLSNHTQPGEQAIIDKFDGIGFQDRGYTLGVLDGALFSRVAQDRQVVQVTDTLQLRNNQWYSAVGLYDGSQLRLLLDDQERAAKEMTGLLSYSDVPLVIGAGSAIEPTDFNRYFSGMIDEVRIRTGIEYEDFDIIRVAVVDLSEFERLEDFYDSQLLHDFYHEWLNFHRIVEEPSWEDLKQLWGNFFKIASDQPLQLKGAFAEGTVIGVEGLNGIEVAAMRNGRIVYRGTEVALGKKGITTSVEISLGPPQYP